MGSAVLEAEAGEVVAASVGRFQWLLGANLRAVRMALGLSLADVTERSGGRFKGPTVCAWERGWRAVHPEVLVELAAFYGTDAAELIPPVGDVPRLSDWG
jgi:transcriptional regulator with XRE-family HTH domain